MTERRTREDKGARPLSFPGTDLLPDPVGIVWAIRDHSGAIADLLTGYSNPAAARMIGVPLEESIGRVEAHGGEIWAESADGSGTVMRFTLPAVTRGR